MPAVVATLNLPTGLAIGFGDALFISDTANNVVRQLGADGIIRTVAGTGEAGYRGDGDPAVYAELHDPGGLAFDDEGNLYIADALNQRIRRVDVKGEIVTVAGTGIAAFGCHQHRHANDYPAGGCGRSSRRHLCRRRR